MIRKILPDGVLTIVPDEDHYWPFTSNQITVRVKSCGAEELLRMNWSLRETRNDSGLKMNLYRVAFSHPRSTRSCLSAAFER